jgi:elongation factor G
MAKQKPEDIRNVVLAGHGGTGKTTLLDEMLFAAKANSRLGRVKEGSSLSDTAEDEIDGQASIDLSVLHCSYKGKLFHIFDTPGRSDFVGAYVAALRATETVLVTVDGYSGIQVNTRKSWKMAKDQGKTVALVVTKLDQENVDLPKIIADIRATFGSACVPFFLPDTTGGDISKIYSVLSPPDDAPDMVNEFHEPLIESIVESDEELMMRYLEGEDVSAEIEEHVASAIQSGTIVPILCYGQKDSLGVTEILDSVAAYFPSAADRKTLPVVKTDEEGNSLVEEVELDPNTFVAQVFKIVVDEHKGRMALMRVFSGTSVAGATYHNANRGKTAKFGKLFKFFGTKHEDADNITAGDIVAAAKIDDLTVCDTLTDGTWTDPIEAIAFPVPMVARAIRPKSRADEQKMMPTLQRFAAEDPTFRSEVDRQTKELVIFGLSELHITVILNRMFRKSGVEVETRLPKISYRETITKEVSDLYRHKKQSGGAGEFAEVHLRMRPNKEEDFLFVDALRGDNVRRQFVPSVEKGCRAIMQRGILTGSPVIWVEVEFYDGKDHPVDGKDGAFQKAAAGCFKKCFLAASPALLEPMVNLEVTFPHEAAGDINQYVSGHRGKPQGMEMLGDEQMLRALIPMAEIQTFSSDLRSMTQGQGSYAMDFAGYERLPAHVQQQVVDKFAADAAEDD